MTALGKLLSLFPDLAPVEPRIVLVESEPDAAHHDIGYAPVRPRPEPPADAPRCWGCDEVPPDGMLHSVGTSARRTHCARCAGRQNARVVARRPRHRGRQ